MASTGPIRLPSEPRVRRDGPTSRRARSIPTRRSGRSSTSLDPARRLDGLKGAALPRRIAQAPMSADTAISRDSPRERATSAAWRSALCAFDDDLRRRAVARRPGGHMRSTARQFARLGQRTASWSRPRSTSARYGATPPAFRARAAPSTVARKLAALRGLFRAQVELGVRSENPAELLSSPKRPQRLPRVLKPSEVAMLLDGIPATGPLELRDRALFELAYASGLRAEELVSLDVDSVDFDSESVRVEGKGGKTRVVPDGRACAAGHRALSRARSCGAGHRAGYRSRSPLFLSKSGRRLGTSDVRRRLRVWARRAAARRPGARRCPSARTASLVRDAPARGGRRPASDPGAAGPCHHLDDSGIHSGRVGATKVSLRARTSPRVRAITGGEWKPTSKRSSYRICGGDTKPRVRNVRASGWSSPTRRWSSTSPVV